MKYGLSKHKQLFQKQKSLIPNHALNLLENESDFGIVGAVCLVPS